MSSGERQSVHGTEIADYQAVNNPAKPLDAMRRPNANAELRKIANTIKEAAIRPIDPPPNGEPLRPIRVFEPEIILIPAGEFLMGSHPQQDEDAFADEQPQHRLFLADYYLAKTPVTQVQ